MNRGNQSYLNNAANLTKMKMQLPFFTGTDSDLLRSESTRDPLGLLPVWSQVGHELIPGLASIVSRIDGIQGILFLYTCLNALSKETRSKKIDEKVLKFLERLWEYHLYKQTDKNPCFGVTSLSGADFQLSISKMGTVGTGLRQYYRGTCVNKHILASDLKTLNEPYLRLCKRYLNKNMISWLEGHAKEMGAKEYSISAELAYQQVRSFLVQFSKADAELWIELEKDLINDAQQKHWIEAAFKRSNDLRDEKIHPRQLVSTIQQYAIENKYDDVANKCQNILSCEPFLQVVESAFLLTQKSARASIKELSERLSSTAPNRLSEVCQNFIHIGMSSPRFNQLKHLAEELSKKNYRGFILALLSNHYLSICKSRGKSPVVQVDGDMVIAALLNDSQDNWTESPEIWRNGYFLDAQMGLYVDLQSRMKVSHG
ncbi:hypothetical protein KDM87_15290 [Undibacterium sp. FT147W]|uniref:Uncharacterized protein n=1 Tax=Undibacterium rivi TaxID=2828729 RepID=A0ABS5H4Y9_9BURK|nr:hypothetical protein [Undibacterium rivi]MBR7793956.1 hypothetical protein [Undibacterium rivi]